MYLQVPIVKFASRLYRVEADLSLYNVLAQRNTAMLLRYSQIDGRVRALGYCVKEFAKVSKLHPQSSHVTNKIETSAVIIFDWLLPHWPSVLQSSELSLHVISHPDSLSIYSSIFSIITVVCSLQRCDIGDASRGTLSSYAYIIMLIFYLQQCDPPVLPVLQEVCKSQLSHTPFPTA